MLFNSYIFIFAFLPLAVAGYYLIGAFGRKTSAIVWLIACSLFFYGWWNPVYLLLLVISIVFNYSISNFLFPERRKRPAAKLALVIGIGGNLAALAYFKYANFFVDTINSVSGADWTLEKIILPLAISFFTFQQITYLVDTYRGLQKDRKFLHYCLFVTFFPQLIAGPIVHHSEMLPQFARDSIGRIGTDRIAIGVTIFLIGLFKKTVLADNIGVYADRIYSAAENGEGITFLEAWVGVFSYSFQIYFDFSGYSDMAIGLGWLFGIRLPVNFYSPYRSQNIIEFWRRWHMTLSRFLKDYLYIPLGGSRKGAGRTRINLMITMLLGGLWHGAGWTFVIWGALHGFYLLANHSWRDRTFLTSMSFPPALSRGISWLVTFLAVGIAWLFFRAESLDGAMRMLSGIGGINGIVLPDTYHGYLGPLGPAAAALGIEFRSALTIPYFEGVTQIAELALLLAICLIFPNTTQLVRALGSAAMTQTGKFGQSARGAWIEWSPSAPWAIAIGLLGLAAILGISADNKFLYFDF